jgi:hypothetical protein
VKANVFRRDAKWSITRYDNAAYLTDNHGNDRTRIVQIVLPSGQLAGAVLPATLGDLSDSVAMDKAADLLILAGFVRQTYTTRVDVFNMPTGPGPVYYQPKQDGGQGKTCFIGCVWLTQAKKLTDANVCFRRYLRWRYKSARGKTLYAQQVVTESALAEYAGYADGLPRTAWQRWSQELERIELQMEFVVKTARAANNVRAILSRQSLISGWLSTNWSSCDPAVACAIAWREQLEVVLREPVCLNKAISRYMEFSPYAEGFFHQFPEVLAAFKEGEMLRNAAYAGHYRTVLKPAAMQQLQSL